MTDEQLAALEQLIDVKILKFAKEIFGDEATPEQTAALADGLEYARKGVKKAFTK